MLNIRTDLSSRRNTSLAFFCRYTKGVKSQEDEVFFFFPVGELNAAFIINLTPQHKTKGRRGGRKEKKVIREDSDHVRAAQNHLLCGELQASAAAFSFWQHES